MLTSWIFYCIFPVLAAIVGAAIALVRPPGPIYRSCIQHFAAGVVFSVVAVELLPDVIKKHQPFYVVLGFVLGVASMLAIKEFTNRLEKDSVESKGRVPTAMLVAISVDILLDGFLIGIGFAAGAKEGVLLAAALTMELLSLGLAIAIELKDVDIPPLKSITIIGAISSLIFVGGGIGALILSSASDSVLETVLSFGLVALLFLVTEELLTEAHEQPETPLTTTAFFVGFLLFLILGMLA